MKKKGFNPKEVYQRTLHFTGDGTYKLIAEAEAIAQRENISLNILFRNALTEFVQRHGKGNNSFQLDQFGVTWTKAIAVTKCAFRECGKTAVGTALYLPKKQTIGLCSFHFPLAMEQKQLYAEAKWIDTLGDL